MSRMIPTAYEMQLERVRAEEVTTLKAQRDALLATLEVVSVKLEALLNAPEFDDVAVFSPAADKAVCELRAAIKGAKPHE